MTSSGKRGRGIPKLAICLALVIIVLVISGTIIARSGLYPGSAPQANPVTDHQGEVYKGTTALTSMLPGADPGSGKVADIPVVPEELESATLQLAGPDSSSLTPYTKRGFDKATVAAIAWWKEPGFYDNTTEYRNYLRATPERRANYSEARQIYFDFITSKLDPAIEASPQKEDLILFRGIGPGLTRSVLTNGTYVEPAYPSTSYDVSISLILFGARGDDGYKNVLVMQREKGEKSLYIDEEEREFLLPGNTTWNVIKAVTIENLTIEADYPLLSNNETTDSVSKVRLMYIKEVV